jgi:Dyp-type peroxidase family
MKPADFLERADIQGNVLRGYGYEHAAYLFLAVNDPGAARAWLRGLRVEDALGWGEDEASESAPKPPLTLNVAFTFDGLHALEVPEEVLATFPADFREGMAARAHQLGDVDGSAPEHWQPGLQDGEADILVTLHARTGDDLQDAITAHREDLRGVSVARLQRANSHNGQREHFGFTDGFAQPGIEGDGRGVVPGRGLPERWWPWQRWNDPDRPRSRNERWLAWRSLKAGEFVLGYEDEDGGLPAAPAAPYGRNGTFMVWRKLEQDVPAFRAFTTREEERLGSRPGFVAAKMVGRWPDGSPLALRPRGPDVALGDDKERVNDYRYRDDTDGAACPLGAHTRRVNPRDALGWGNRRARRHRLVRRGMPYGPELVEGENEADERGLVFVCLQASIARQFEIVQSNWINDGNLFGLGDDRDPITAVTNGSGRMVVHGPDVCILGPLPSFTTLRGGAYLFVPGLAALRAIAFD